MKTFDEWWETQKRPQAEERATNAGPRREESYRRAEAVMRCAAEAAWNAAIRECEDSIKELELPREALGNATDASVTA